MQKNNGNCGFGQNFGQNVGFINGIYARETRLNYCI